MALRISKEALRVSKAKAELESMIIRTAYDDFDLTSIELLQALTSVQATVLKYMLRAERHPDDPDKSTDIE